MSSVKPERSRWRDLRLNDRHREWGWNCPAEDIDFIEYDECRAVALIEYKHESAAPIHTGKPDANLRAFLDLGNCAGKPTFIVRYANDFSWWKVRALNERAKKWVPVTVKLSEAQFVEFLYRLRGRTVPPEVEKLWMPTEEEPL